MLLQEEDQKVQGTHNNTCTGIPRGKLYQQIIKILYEKAVGILWNQELSQWVNVNYDEGCRAIGFFSLKDVLKAFEVGCADLKKQNAQHNRAIVFASMHAFQGFFGDGASRLKVDGQVAFLGATVGTYNPNEKWYKGNGRVFGQLTDKERRGHSENFVTDHVDVHGVVGLNEGEVCVELVLIADAYNWQSSDADEGTTDMLMKEVLTGNPKTYTTPPIQLLAMPAQSPGHQESLLKIMASATVCTLLRLLSTGRAVMKGIANETSTSSAGTDLLLHELAKIGCSYPAQVVESIRAHYEAK